MRTFVVQVLHTKRVLDCVSGWPLASKLVLANQRLDGAELFAAFLPYFLTILNVRFMA